MKSLYNLSGKIRIIFLLVGLSSSIKLMGQKDKTFQSPDIEIDQIGYYPIGNKMAFYKGNLPSPVFYILDSNTQSVVFKGKAAVSRKSDYSRLVSTSLDFSDLKKEGTYFVEIPNLGRSYYFKIKNAVYRDLGIALIKGYYFQRASLKLIPEYAGKWARAEGHPDSTVFVHGSAISQNRPLGYSINASGGWYDAGDYNKYMVNSGISMGTLLSAYEDFPPYFRSLKTGIPESKSGIPDILNESLYNLRWMLKMQDPSDGGVYNKCTNSAFDAMIMPDKALSPRYVVQKGTAASLDFAAVMAQSARIFMRYENELPGLSDSCLKASEKAWTWALKNPEMVYSQRKINSVFNPPINTGEYGDRNFDDEWFWAASEIYTTYSYFHKKDVQPYYSVMANSRDQSYLPSWSQVGMLGYYSLVRNEKNLGKEVEILKDSIKSRIVRKADGLVQNFGKIGYNCIMGSKVSDFSWGSNSVASNQGILLIQAYTITRNKKYINFAYSNLHYLLGANPTGFCFVTGLGTHSPMHPHHRVSIADGILAPIPGLLVGGPNPGRQDNQKYEFLDPETSYTDQDGAYASNEIAINWNAPLVYLANSLEFLYPKKFNK